MPQKDIKKKDTSNWVRARTVRTIWECIGVTLIGVGLSVGLICDLLEVSIHLVEDLSSVALTALQIHATISAITIALVALISGSISEEYYGISVSNYYLNIKPVLFKQNVIIISSLLLVGMNMLAYIFCCYNLVITILWVNCFLIVISVVELYSAFKGRRSVACEINQYIDYVFYGSYVSFEKKAEVLINYGAYWAEQNQNKVDYETDKERYLKAITALLEIDDCSALKIIYEVSTNLVKKMLAVSDDRRRHRGFEVLEETYCQIWKYIVSHDQKHINQSFELYGECVDELLQGIYKLPSDDFEHTIRWERLTDYILRVSIFCHDEEETDMTSLQKTMKPVRWFVSFVGNAIAEKKKKGESINNSRWKFSTGLLFISCSNIPEFVKMEYMKIQYQYLFAYFRALLDSCQTEIAGSVFDKMHLSYGRQQDEIVLFILWVLCYTYYIGERESLACISTQERESAQALLEKWRKANIVNNFIEEVSWRIGKQSRINFYFSFCESMENCERLPFDDSMKSCIMGGVERDFFLYFAVLSSGTCAGNHLLEDMVSTGNVTDWYYSYLGGNTDSTNKKLNQMLTIWTLDPSQYTDMIDAGMGSFNEIVLSRYKEKEIIGALSNYNGFSLENRNGEVIKEIKEFLLDHLNKKISAWCSLPEKEMCCERIVLLKYTAHTDSVNKEWIGHITPHLETSLLGALVNMLKKLGRVNIYERNKDIADDDYLSFLSNGDYKYLIGPDRIFAPFNYKKRKQLDHITMNSTRVHMGQGDFGLLLKPHELKISVTDFNITTKSMSLEDCEYEFDPESKMYTYAPATGVSFKFTKEELENYLHNEFLILFFTVKLNMSIPQEDLGYLVIRE